jgi:uncharacterized membrane protein YdbT with pleckstrin-like domain
MPEVFKTTKPGELSKEELEKEIEKEVVSRGLKKGEKNPLTAFAFKPKKVNFIAADSQEKIILLLRRHPITNLPWILTASLMATVPLILSYFDFLNFVPPNFQLVILMLWFLITIAFVMEKFLSWYFNVYIITDERVFDVDFINLVYREITDANIDQIQDVTVRVGSVIRTVFNYGDVLIQTAAEIPQIEFDAVPKPDLVAQVLRELRVEEEVEKLEGRTR